MLKMPVKAVIQESAVPHIWALVGHVILASAAAAITV
jgi:hypothetical protein